MNGAFVAWLAGTGRTVDRTQHDIALEAWNAAIEANATWMEREGWSHMGDRMRRRFVAKAASEPKARVLTCAWPECDCPKGIAECPHAGSASEERSS